MSGAGDEPSGWGPEYGQAGNRESQTPSEPAGEAGSGGQAPPSFGGADGGPHWPGVARPAGWFLQMPRDPAPEAPGPEPARPEPPQVPGSFATPDPAVWNPEDGDAAADSPGWDETDDPVTWEADDPATPDQASWNGAGDAAPPQPQAWNAAAADEAYDPDKWDPADGPGAWEPAGNPAAWEAPDGSAVWDVEAAQPASWDQDRAESRGEDSHAGEPFPGPREPGGGEWYIAGQDGPGNEAAYWYQDPGETGASPAAPFPQPPPPTAQPAPEPAAGPTSAVRGLPGGPGFAVPPGMVAGLYDPARRSAWQQAQGLWRESGVRWERPAIPATRPQPQQPPQQPQQPRSRPEPPLPQPQARPQERRSQQRQPQQSPWNASAAAPPTRPTPRRTRGNGASTPEAFGPGHLPLGAPPAAMKTADPGDPYRTWHEEPDTRWTPPELTEYPELSRVRVRRGPRPRRRHTSMPVLRIGLPVLVIVVVGAGAVMLLTGKTNMLLAAHGNRTTGTTATSAQATQGEPSASAGTATSGTGSSAAGTSGTVVPATFPGYPGKGTGRLTVSAIATTGDEQVAAGSAGGYPAMWRRGPGGSWSLASGVLSGRPGAEAMKDVTHGPAGWLAVGDVVSGAPQHPVVVTSGDGATWRAADGEPAFSESGEYAYGAASGNAGYVIVGKRMSRGRTYAAVWWSASLDGWTRADNGGLDGRLKSSEMLAVTAGPNGFLAVGAHGSDPAVWTSGDGRHWTVSDVPAPSGASSAVLGQVAVNRARVVATGDAVTRAGTVPFAEVSADGGARWQEVALPAPGSQVSVTALAASGAGFTAAGTFGSQAVTWTSADGTTWTAARPLGNGVQEITGLISADNTMTGVGDAITQRGARPILWTAPAP